MFPEWCAPECLRCPRFGDASLFSLGNLGSDVRHSGSKVSVDIVHPQGKLRLLRSSRAFQRDLGSVELSANASLLVLLICRYEATVFLGFRLALLCLVYAVSGSLFGVVAKTNADSARQLLEVRHGNANLVQQHQRIWPCFEDARSAKDRPIAQF